MNPSIDEAELRGMLERATERPWRVSDGGGSIRRKRMVHRADGSEVGEVDSRLMHGYDGNAAQRDIDYSLVVAAVNSLPTLLDELSRLRRALEPFATFAADNVDETGWAGNRCEGERIVDWFGPSDFRAARSALNQETDHGG